MPSARPENREAEWFGYTRVRPEDKAGLVERVFDSVAGRYDLMNDLMSGGVHRLWKDRFVRLMRPRADTPLLDVAGGTGDIAFRYLRRGGPGARVTVCDINAEMLAVGRARALDRGHARDVTWVRGDAQALPFEDNAFGLYSISFGLRNVPRIDDALRDAWRVLKPGGRFFCLEFSDVKNPLVKAAYDAFSFHVIPAIGAAVTGDEDSYRYLVESIRQFPKAEALRARALAAGFDRVDVLPLSGGIAAIHIGHKY